jgi:ABC-type glutathione transport system ATPase component
MNEVLLEIKDLTVSIGKRRVIDNVNISLERGMTTALVGESGSGKTLTALSALDLLPVTAVKEKGGVWVKGENIFSFSPDRMRRTRGKEIAMVFQEPFTALNPVMRIGEQISEAMLAHGTHDVPGAKERLRELFEAVRLHQGIAARYPHELSGGMRQRAVLAMAISCSPDVLILDEPTTALDVSIQKEMLDLIKKLQRELKFSILFITHDFSIVRVISDEVCVMREGAVVEKRRTEGILRDPRHEYTRRLIGCIPRLGDTRRRLPA